MDLYPPFDNLTDNELMKHNKMVKKRGRGLEWHRNCPKCGNKLIKGDWPHICLKCNNK